MKKSSAIFTPEFFRAPAGLVAPRLLGAKITTTGGKKVTSGIIVETEAYGGAEDLACHAASGRTGRNEVMFWEGGHCYVYFIYGMHYCVNVVTGPKGCGEAVLVRALEPLEGLDTMKQRRGKKVQENNLTNGPAKLCYALDIDQRMLGENLLASRLIRIEPYLEVGADEIGNSRRIGISKAKDLPWRFYIRNNRWVSRA